MGCVNCGQNPKGKGYIKTICRVCQIVDKDNSEKMVTYCETCKAYICDFCWNNWGRRALAFGKNLLNRSVNPTNNLNTK